MVQDSNSGRPNTNFTPGSKLEAVQPISKGFNKGESLANQIARMPEEHRENCRLIEAIGKEDVKGLKNYQAVTFDERIDEKAKNMKEKYDRNPALRPQIIRDNPAQDEAIIQQQATRQTIRGDEWAIKSREKATTSQLFTYAKMHREGQLKDHDKARTEIERNPMERGVSSDGPHHDQEMER